MRKKVNGTIYLAVPCTNACHGCDAFPSLKMAVFRSGDLDHCDCTKLGEICVDRNIVWKKVIKCRG